MKTIEEIILKEIGKDILIMVKQMAYFDKEVNKLPLNIKDAIYDKMMSQTLEAIRKYGDNTSTPSVEGVKKSLRTWYRNIRMQLSSNYKRSKECIKERNKKDFVSIDDSGHLTHIELFKEQKREDIAQSNYRDQLEKISYAYTLLDKRELHVANLLSAGENRASIVVRLGISERTLARSVAKIRAVFIDILKNLNKFPETWQLKPTSEQ